MTDENSIPSPSLIEPQSRGGEIAGGGLSFQEEVLIAKVPYWLADEGFTSFIQESIGDAEAKFFVPGHTFQKEFIEVKNHSLSGTEFWQEIQRFYQVDRSNPNVYRRFYLVATGIVQKLNPLISALDRIRSTGDFHLDSSAIWNSSYDGYVEIVQRLEKDTAIANFIFDRVCIELDWNSVKADGYGLFESSLVQNFVDYEDLSARRLKEMYEKIKTILRNHINKPIARAQIERCLESRQLSEKSVSHKAIKLLTANSVAVDENETAIVLRWADFFGSGRNYPRAEEWQNRLLKDLQQAKKWILTERATRRIHVMGSRRLSASVALGTVFSAVSGFSLEMDYRSGDIWKTDAHADRDTPRYNLSEYCQVNQSEVLAVSIGIPRSIASDVDNNLQRLGLADASVLHFHGKEAIISQQQANLVSSMLKERIRDKVISCNARVIHLFVAIPAPLAIFLGHRLNAMCVIQCYEWNNSFEYVSTCLLET